MWLTVVSLPDTAGLCGQQGTNAVGYEMRIKTLRRQWRMWLTVAPDRMTHIWHSAGLLDLHDMAIVGLMVPSQADSYRSCLHSNGTGVSVL